MGGNNLAEHHPLSKSTRGAMGESVLMTACIENFAFSSMQCHVLCTLRCVFSHSSHACFCACIHSR